MRSSITPWRLPSRRFLFLLLVGSLLFPLLQTSTAEALSSGPVTVNVQVNGQDGDPAGLLPTFDEGELLTVSYSVTTSLPNDQFNFTVAGVGLDLGTCDSAPPSTATIVCHDAAIAAPGPLGGSTCITISVSAVSLADNFEFSGQDVSCYDVIEPLLTLPSIDVVMSIDGDDANTAPGPEFALGSVVDITYDVTNTGNVALNGIAITDSARGTISCPTASLALGESMQCATTDTLAVAGAATDVATATGAYQSELVQDSDPVNFTVINPAAPAIDLVMKIEGDDANTAPGPEFTVGDFATITFDVTNTGDVDLVDVVVDGATTGVSCPQTTLAVGESFQCAITTALTAPGAALLLGEARGSYQSEVVVDTDPINFVVVESAAPSLSLVKRVEGFDANTAPGPEFHVGDVVEITYDVTNDGNVDLVDVVVDDVWVGVISCPQDTLAVGETFRCSITETLIDVYTFFSPIFMEAEARGSFQSEVVRDDDPVNFTVVEPLGIVECGFSVGRGVLSLRTDQNPVFLNAQYLVHQGGESSPSLVLDADDAQTRLDFQGMFYELAWFGLPRFTSVDVTITPVYSVPGSRELKTGAKTVCSRYSSPIGLDIDQSGAVERITADVEFDFDADGTVETATEWFAPSEGILFDTTIDGPLTGEHLFGDQGGLFRDGYAKLQQRDLNNDGMVSGAELNGLALWTDSNTNGVLDPGETVNLTATGVVSLSTSHINYTSQATLADGTTMVTEDLWFPVTAAPVAGSSNVVRNLGVSLAVVAIAAAGFVVARRMQRRRNLDNELAQILSSHEVNA